MIVYTVCLYQEDDNDYIWNYDSKEKAIQLFKNYLNEYIYEELEVIVNDLANPEVYTQYSLDLINYWRQYYYEQIPKYKKAIKDLENYNDELIINYIGEYGYIYKNEVQ